MASPGDFGCINWKLIGINFILSNIYSNWSSFAHENKAGSIDYVVIFLEKEKHYYKDYKCQVLKYT